MKIEYKVYLSDQLIGTTNLEHADVPMGTVYGILYLNSKKYNYRFWVNYCVKHHIKLCVNEPKEKVISTAHIPALKVVDSHSCVHVPYQSSQITGVNAQHYEIILRGINSPLFDKIFPHHSQAYHLLDKV